MTRLGRDSRLIRLKSCEPTFYGTVFVHQKTCLTSVDSWRVSRLHCRHELMTIFVGTYPPTRWNALRCVATEERLVAQFCAQDTPSLHRRAGLPIDSVS